MHPFAPLQKAKAWAQAAYSTRLTLSLWLIHIHPSQLSSGIPSSGYVFIGLNPTHRAGEAVHPLGPYTALYLPPSRHVPGAR